LKAFHAAIRSEHGKAGAQFSDLVESGEMGSQLWSAKNATLELSLDVNWLFSGDLYERQLRLLAKWCERGGVSRILDVGCDAGMISCFLALILPTAEVVGVDRCAHTIENAATLARRCGASNARFEAVDIDELEGAIAGGNFDLIVASRVLIRPGRDRSGEVWTLSEAEEAPPDDLVFRAGALNRSQIAGGCLWALERLRTHLDIARFIGALKQGGYTPAAQKCSMLETTEVTGRQNMPVILAENTRGSVSIYEVFEHLKRTPARPRLNKIYVDRDADVLFNKVGLRNLAYACEVFNDSFVRVEIWSCVEGVADYRRRDDGGRQLKLVPGADEAAAVAAARELAEALAGEPYSQDDPRVSRPDRG
jgi:SAM-dependent methyltransferase